MIDRPVTSDQASLSRALRRRKLRGTRYTLPCVAISLPERQWLSIGSSLSHQSPPNKVPHEVSAFVSSWVQSSVFLSSIHFVLRCCRCHIRLVDVWLHGRMVCQFSEKVFEIMDQFQPFRRCVFRLWIRKGALCELSSCGGVGIHRSCHVVSNATEMQGK